MSLDLAAEVDSGEHAMTTRSAVRDLSDVTYILAALFFILSLSGLSKHETATRGNIYGGQLRTPHSLTPPLARAAACGMMGADHSLLLCCPCVCVCVCVSAVVAMTLSIVVTLFDPAFGHPLAFAAALAPGFAIGTFLALRVQMTSMPQLVALLHSFVGVAAVLVGVANAVSDEPGRYNASPLLHKIEIFLGVFIGSVTVTGSLVAAGKLHELLRSAPLILGGSSTFRHGFNLSILVLCALLGWRYCDDLDSYTAGLEELLAMVVLAGVLGWHLVMVGRYAALATRSAASHQSRRPLTDCCVSSLMPAVPSPEVGEDPPSTQHHSSTLSAPLSTVLVLLIA